MDVYPIPLTKTNKYQSFIHYALTWLNITNWTVYWYILMSVLIVGGELLFWFDYLRTLDYLLYTFVLRSFYCISENSLSVHYIVSFLAF